MVCSLHLFLACPETEASAEWAAPSSHETRLHIKQIKNEGLLLSTGNSAQQSGVVKESRKEETRAYLTDSLRCKPEANTALQTSYTPIKNKARKKPENRKARAPTQEEAHTRPTP